MVLSSGSSLTPPFLWLLLLLLPLLLLLLSLLLWSFPGYAHCSGSGGPLAPHSPPAGALRSSERQGERRVEQMSVTLHHSILLPLCISLMDQQVTLVDQQPTLVDQQPSRTVAHSGGTVHSRRRMRRLTLSSRICTVRETCLHTVCR